MIKTSIILLLCFTIFKVGKCQTGYIDTYPGTLPIILGAPHGGTLEPSEIPNRDAGCPNLAQGACEYNHFCSPKDSSLCGVTTVRDTYTSELTLAIRDALYELTGQYPPTVVCLLRRTKLDPNRDIGEAAFGVPLAEEAWWEFQNFINSSRAQIEANSPGGMGVFFDIHGHGHPDQWAEVGYLLTGTNLDLDEFEENVTSIRHLANYNGYTGANFENLLRGSVSFGAYMESELYAAVPSPANPSPLGASFFSGGYNTRTHGSQVRGKVDAIQIESPRSFREEAILYGNGLARAMLNFVTQNYPQGLGIKLRK